MSLCVCFNAFVALTSRQLSCLSRAIGDLALIIEILQSVKIHGFGKQEHQEFGHYQREFFGAMTDINRRKDFVKLSSNSFMHPILHFWC